MVVDDIVGIIFLLAAGKGVDCRPFLAVVAEFGDDLTAEDAWVVLARDGCDDYNSYLWHR